MLNAGTLLFDGAGRIRNTATGTPDAFNAGVPTRAGLLLTALAGGNAFVNGMPFFQIAGALCAQAAAPTGYAQGGLPITAAGMVAIDANGAIDHYLAGLPFTAADRLCLAAAE